MNIALHASDGAATNLPVKSRAAAGSTGIRRERLRTNSATSAFTLLEVMVAVGILGVALTAIFSSEAGAIKMAHSSRKMGLGVELARCKMGEIEEKIAKEGLPAVFSSNSDKCCEKAEIEGFNCDWEIDRILLPDAVFEQKDEKEGKSRVKDSFTSSDVVQTAATDPTSLLSGGNGQLAAATDPMTLLSGGNNQLMGSITSMAIQIVYPILKPSIEEQIRRVTITVRWYEGKREHSFKVSEYYVAEQPPPTEDQQQQDEQGQQQTTQTNQTTQTGVTPTL
jgi:general secretion pathway protein I